MSESTENPYAAAHITEISQGPLGDGISKNAATLSRWQVICSCALIVIGAGILLIMLLSVFSLGQNNFEVLFFLGIYSLIALFLFLVPGVLLWQAASQSKMTTNDPSRSQLESMLKYQVRFWRVVGVGLILLVGLFVLLLIGTLVS